MPGCTVCWYQKLQFSRLSLSRTISSLESTTAPLLQENLWLVSQPLRKLLLQHRYQSRPMSAMDRFTAGPSLMSNAMSWTIMDSKTMWLDHATLASSSTRMVTPTPAWASLTLKLSLVILGTYVDPLPSKARIIQIW